MNNLGNLTPVVNTEHQVSVTYRLIRPRALSVSIFKYYDSRLNWTGLLRLSIPGRVIPIFMIQEGHITEDWPYHHNGNWPGAQGIFGNGNVQQPFAANFSADRLARAFRLIVRNSTSKGCQFCVTNIGLFSGFFRLTQRRANQDEVGAQCPRALPFGNPPAHKSNLFGRYFNLTDFLPLNDCLVDYSEELIDIALTPFIAKTIACCDLMAFVYNRLSLTVMYGGGCPVLLTCPPLDMHSDNVSTKIVTFFDESSGGVVSRGTALPAMTGHCQVMSELTSLQTVMSQNALQLAVSKVRTEAAGATGQYHSY